MCNKKLIMASMVFTALFVIPLSASAESIDPTRPPIFRAKVKPESHPRIKVNAYKVTSILISEQRKVAVVNGQVVSVGDKVKAEQSGQATVLAISSQSVKLGKAQREFVVRLPSSRYSKIDVVVPNSGQKDER